MVRTVAAAKQQLSASPFDVALVDYDLDDGKGDELVRWIRASASGQRALGAAGADAIGAKLQLATIGSVIASLLE